MRNKKLPPFTIAIDNRERLGYSYSNSISVRLETGDYAILEAPLAITIDRKSPEDAVGTVTQHRDRFILELERMAEFSFAAIVIEASLEDLLKPYARSRANPKSVVQSFMSFQIRYGIHVIFAGSRILGRNVTFRLLEFAWEKKCQELGLAY